MNNQRVFNGRSVGLAQALIVTTMVAAGCCFVPPRTGDGEAVAREAIATEAIPILVTLATEEGEALAVTRERVLAHLREVMSAKAFAAIRVYVALPVVALSATPEVVALLLNHPDVHSLEADRSFSHP